jgi:hypothetical protein
MRMSSVGGDLSSSESEFFCKRTPKEGREWMLSWIVRFPTAFIHRMREGRRRHGGETIDSEWSSSILPFCEEERKRQRLFQKGKGAHTAALGSHTEGPLEDAAVRWLTMAAGFGRRLD